MYKQKKLKNDLKLITVPMEGTRTATILVLFGTGSKFETRENNGISHFLEHMFFKGTKNRPSTLAISSELDSVGAEFNAFTGKELTGYWVKADSSKLELAIDVVSDMLLNSKMKAEEIEREKGVIIEEMNMYHDNPMMHIEDVFESCLYGDTPAGWEIIGTRDNILNFQREDFIKYFKSQYGVENSVVCVAGDLLKAEKLASKHFKDFKSSKFSDKFLTTEKQSEPNLKINFKDTNQATLSLGVRSYPLNHKDEYISRVLTIVLGGSMSSRMFTEVRERRGLAYYVRTQSELYTDTGYITTQAGVPVAKTEEAIKTIINEYKKTIKKEISEEELAKTKDLIKGRTVLQLESSDSMANWYAKQALQRKEIMDLDFYFKKIDSVTVEDLQRVASDIFKNEGLNLALIGPFKSEMKFKELLSI